MNELALFAGAGGGILGGKLLDWRTVCAVERDAYAAQVLAQRQNDGILEAFPIWSDVRSFDGRPWRGIIDVISGGFPCQDISPAGKGEGITGERSGLWSEMARIIREVRPRYTFIENSPMLTTRGLEQILCDLAKMGLNAEWCVLGAYDCGAKHIRNRIWILAYSKKKAPGTNSDTNKINSRQGSDQQPKRQEFSCIRQVISNPDGMRSQGSTFTKKDSAASGKLNSRRTTTRTYSARTIRTSEWPIEPDVGRVANGVDFRVDRLKAIGNGQVPRVAAAAFALLQARIESS